MKSSSLTQILSELIEALCLVFGKLISELLFKFPFLEKYFSAFYSGLSIVASEKC